MHHVAVALDLHELAHLDRPVVRHPAEIVASEVHEHHVLRPLLRVTQQLLGQRPVLLRRRSTGTSTGDGTRRDLPAGDRDQRLRTGAGNLEVAEVEEIHVRTGVHGPEAAIDREPLHRHGGRPPLRGHDLVGVAGADVLDDPGDDRLKFAVSHVGFKRRDLPVPPVFDRGRTRNRTAQTTAHLGDGVHSLPVGGLEVVLHVGVCQHRDRALEVVEDDQRVAKHQGQIGQAERIGVGLPQRLDGPHEVIGEHAHRPAGERREARERGGIEATQLSAATA